MIRALVNITPTLRSGRFLRPITFFRPNAVIRHEMHPCADSPTAAAQDRRIDLMLTTDGDRGDTLLAYVAAFCFLVIFIILALDALVG